MSMFSRMWKITINFNRPLQAVFDDTIRVIVEAADEVVAGGAAEAGIQNEAVSIVAIGALPIFDSVRS